MSGGSNNATIAIPGHDWNMMWPYQFDNFQLDIVGFLAVLGEGSILSTSQVSALSSFFYLPRLLPAPQALLRTARPTSLSSVPAVVTAVHSGNKKEQIHHVANILLGVEMPAYTVRCVRIKKVNTRKRTMTPKQLARAKAANPPDTVFTPPLVKAKTWGPLTWVTLLGFSLSLMLFLISFLLGDGMSLLATILLSLLSTLVGISNKWNLRLSQVTGKDGKLPEGDVVIRYPNGSFLIVFCEEVVARELYFAPEEIVYELKSDAMYRIISLIGTLLLMLGVIFLANAKLQLQFCWGAAYVVINAAHWVAAALPARLHWDLSCYELEEQGISGENSGGTFMNALATAIMVTRSTEWVSNGQAAPQTERWNRWLKEVEQASSMVREDVGKVTDPIWDTAAAQNRGTIWVLPEEEKFSARGTFNKLGGNVATPARTPARTNPSSKGPSVTLGAANPETVDIEMATF